MTRGASEVVRRPTKKRMAFNLETYESCRFARSLSDDDWMIPGKVGSRVAGY